jgi:hypothetical protein
VIEPMTSAMLLSTASLIIRSNSPTARLSLRAVSSPGMLVRASRCSAFGCISGWRVRKVKGYRHRSICQPLDRGRG